jgi:hypothetical protein
MMEGVRRTPMHQVQLPDHVYEEAVRRAREAGFDSVDAYVADVLQDDRERPGGTDDLDARFTPEVLESLDETAAAVSRGEFITYEGLKAESRAWSSPER